MRVRHGCRSAGRLVLPLLATVLLAGLPSLLHAQVERPRAPIALTATQKVRYRALLPTLRCMVCQNESLAASQAPLAADLRYQIRGLLAKGESDAQIKQYLVDRYGQYVLYKPRFEPLTWLLWLGPFLLLLVAVIVAVRLVRRHRAAAPNPPPLDREALHRLLDDRR